MSKRFRRGIPTKFAGVRFRSRLEARWAAFFDALGWEWSYEPIELDGYIPDFVLHFDPADIMVEVKPFLRMQSPEIREAINKATLSGWEGSGVVVGARLFDGRAGLILGEGFDDSGRSSPCPLGTCPLCGEVSIAPLGVCAACGKPSSPSFRDAIAERKRVWAAWTEAGNQVQWRRPA